MKHRKKTPRVLLILTRRQADALLDAAILADSEIESFPHSVSGRTWKRLRAPLGQAIDKLAAAIDFAPTTPPTQEPPQCQSQ